MIDIYAHCQEVVREFNRDRYFTTLFAPADRRPAVFALYAFNAEIAGIRDKVSDALPGEVRLQWWRDVLTGDGHGDVTANPVAAALLETIAKYNLPQEAFLNLIEARVFDLYEDPMPTLADLEGYAGETASVPIQLASMILTDDPAKAMCDASGHGGVAYALTGLLRSLPWHARRRQMYLPGDLLERFGVDPNAVFCGKSTPELKACLAEMRAIARRHMDQTRYKIEGLGKGCGPALLPVALVEPYLNRMERPDYDPLNEVIEIPQWRRQWILWRASRQATKSKAS
ncbi:phytoene/squalene synthase family protein [Breoghania sp.]|uniref:phytoene/squalene synthase family protein n=1 Tax=Breoghania sp. TaxID=2065378 RepID=UPI0026259BDB|nr:phytoene/squalene synthase family protein [Breoghania sp.]MDJ0929615.1 phytoene/squalene synthase family protein [Breoghania sp.]